MCSAEIALEIFSEVEKALDLGFNRIYVNVDDLENGFGFLRVLCRKKSKFLILYEDTLALDICFQILDLFEKSRYDIKDLTTRFNDV